MAPSSASETESESESPSDPGPPADPDTRGLDAPDVARRGGVVAVVLAVLGLGVGATGFLAMGFARAAVARTVVGAFGGSGVVVTVVYLAGLVVVLLLGPVSGGVVSLVAGRREADVRAAVAVGATGSFVGFYLMVVLADLVMGAAKPGTGGTTVNLLSHLDTVVLAGVTTGVVGGVVPFVDAQA